MAEELTYTSLPSSEEPSDLNHRKKLKNVPLSCIKPNSTNETETGGENVSLETGKEQEDEESANSKPLGRHILGFGDETLLHIVEYLLGPDSNHGNLINLAATCTRFNDLLQDRSICEVVKFFWNLKILRDSLVRYLRQRPRSNLVTRFDVTDLYWVPSGVLRDAVVQMPNLRELMTAGAKLSWSHLKEILTTLNNVDSLSWSWDSGLEESIRKKGSISPGRFMELIDLKPKFLKLKNLLLHVPLAANVAPTDLIVCSYTSFVYLISLCQNLEQLWIISWPKTSQERKFSSNFFHEIFETDDINLPNLKALVVDVKEPPRIHIPRLILKLLRNLGKHKIKPKLLWLDDPLISNPFISPRRGISPEDRIWPDLDLTDVERLSYPLSESVRLNIPKPFSSCKAIQITHGKPAIANLSGTFDGASELESMCCKAFNFRMDWRKFALYHPKMKEVHLSKHEGLQYPDYCAALAELPLLEKISVPVEVLVDIKDSRILNEFKDCIEDDSSSKLSSPRPTSSVVSFKKPRVGLSTKPNVNDGLSGLQLLTKRCPNVKEFELGYSSKSCHAGRLLVESLSSIAQWKSLKKLSLDGVPLKHGKSLIYIAQGTSLESIRLSNLGPTAKCVYLTDLCIALKHCPNLKDLRLEQNYLGSVTNLLISLQSCPQLQRLLLWSSPNDSPLCGDSVVSLFESCQDLVVFYAVIEPTLKIVCQKLKKLLNDKYKTSRPCLSVVVETSLEDDRIPSYPSIHFRQLVVNSSQVCQYTEFPPFESV